MLINRAECKDSDSARGDVGWRGFLKVNLSWAPQDSATGWPATRQRRLQAGGCFRQGLCRKQRTQSNWAMGGELIKGLFTETWAGLKGTSGGRAALVTTEARPRPEEAREGSRVQNMRKEHCGRLACQEVRQ